MCSPPTMTTATAKADTTIPTNTALETTKKEETTATSSFRYLDNDEPHVRRRKEILKKYPEIMKLYGPDIRLFYWCIGLLVLEWATAYVTCVYFNYGYGDFMYWFLAWSIGGTWTHSLSLANHELSHNFAFKKPLFNEILGIIVDFGHAIPTFISFKRYHLDHHMYQGDELADQDIPTELESWLIGSTNPLKKAIWVIFQPFNYAFRPVFCYPKPVSKKEIINFVAVALFDMLFAKLFGMKATFFIMASTVLGMGIHPCAGHFIAEHFVFNEGQETYSYYGPLNWISFNVGYHNEHHDFPRVSGFNLPKIKEIAPEYYDERWKTHDGKPMMYYTSWTKVIFDFIFQTGMGPQMRIKRHHKLARKQK